MKGLVQTVRGFVRPGDLGITLPHEHIFFDQDAACYAEPVSSDIKALSEAEITLANRADIFYHVFNTHTNLKQQNPGVAIQEVRLLKDAGGGTIVDVTTDGLSPDPMGLRKVSEAADIHIVAGSGFYVLHSLSEEKKNWLKKATEADIAERIVDGFTKGLFGTDVKAGIIGEIAIEDFECGTQIKILRGAAHAQIELGAALSIHTACDKYKLHLMLDILERMGVDMEKVILCHCGPDADYTHVYNEIAKRGVYLEFDQFSMNFPTMDLHDPQLKRAVMRQLEYGNVNKILLSQDVCFATMLNTYGGFGYRYLLKWFKPLMESEGFKREFDIMTMDNPQKVLPLTKNI